MEWVYLAPSHRAKEAEEKGYPYRLKKSNFNSLDSFYDEEYRLKAREYFLFQYNKFFQKSDVKLESCQQFIHEKMLVKKELMERVIYFARNFYLIKRKYNSIEKLWNAIEENKSRKNKVEEAFNNLKEIQIDWLSFKTNKLLWPRIFTALS